MKRNKVILITTVPISIIYLLNDRIKFLSENNFEVYTICAEGKETQAIEHNSQIKNHFSVSLTRKINPFQDIQAIWQCYKIFKKIKPDIVHTYTPKAGMVGMISSLLAGNILRFHNVTGLPLMEQVGLKKKILIFIERLTYLCATSVYVNSVGLLNYIKQNISQNSKISILGYGSTNGINEDVYSVTNDLEHRAIRLRETLNIRKTDFVWVFVGRIVKDKGINELIEAFERCAIKYSNMKLILVGDFEEDLDPIKPCVKSKIFSDSNIFYVGFQKDIRPYLLMSDCLVFPSYREGLPNVPMQAACLNLPIIATNINGCNEIIQDGVNGLLVESKNTEDLEEKMGLMYKNVSFRNKVKGQTRKLILSKYSQSMVWQNILNEYQRQLKLHEI